MSDCECMYVFACNEPLYVYHLQYLHEERQQRNYTQTAHRGTPTLETAKFLSNSMGYECKREIERKKERKRERKRKKGRQREK